MPIFEVLNVPRLKSSDSGDFVSCFEHMGYDFFILCDGAGGYGNDVESSRLATKTIKKHICQELKPNSDIMDILRESIINACIKLSIGDTGQTTAIVMAISENNGLIASVGDSKAYMFSESIIDLTKYQVKTRAGDFCSPSLTRFDFDADILIGSDGLWDFTSLDFVKSAISLNSSKNVLMELYKESVRNGKFDDFSGILIKRAP